MRVLTELFPRFNPQRHICDLELIMNGGFSPLEGFMNQADYLSCVRSESVSCRTRSTNGRLTNMSLLSSPSARV